MLRPHLVQTDLQLPQHGLSADTERSLLGGLPDGEEDSQTAFERRQNLPVEINVGLMEITSAFGMPEQNQIEVQGEEHPDRDLAGVGAVGSPMYVLGAQPD